MKKPNITEGPWHLNKDEIQAFKTSNVYAGDGVVMLGSSELKESVANARLIAAAPVMAEALEAALVGLESDILYCERHPDSHRTTHEGMLAHKRKRLNDAKAALTLAGYEF